MPKQPPPSFSQLSFRRPRLILSANQLYDAARTYLATRINTDMQRLRVSRVDVSASLGMTSVCPGRSMTSS